VTDFLLVGIAPEATDYLNSGQDICFGKSYAKTDPKCISCRAPAVAGKKVLLLKELCAMECHKTSNIKLNRITSREVLDMLQGGKTVGEIFKVVLGDAEPRLVAAEARILIIERFAYLKTTLGIEVPDVPRTKQLLEG
jgi:hypothetical protein